MKKWVHKERNLLIETVGDDLRKMMPWMEAKKAPEF